MTKAQQCDALCKFGPETQRCMKQAGHCDEHKGLFFGQLIMKWVSEASAQ